MPSILPIIDDFSPLSARSIKPLPLTTLVLNLALLEAGVHPAANPHHRHPTHLPLVIPHLMRQLCLCIEWNTISEECIGCDEYLSRQSNHCRFEGLPSFDEGLSK
ncbi:hypothetical protein PsAD46_00997 [Pseudovibrio sp. Ad46]|nr:hypothetical protein PsAD46_00997 [Pseudovibrio sp. Ad46]